jgi:hypothetical protein
MSQERVCKPFQQVGNAGRDMSAALAIRDDLANMLPRVLERTHEPAKVLAFRAGVSKRTIDGLKRKEHPISAPALIALARQYPGVRALVLSLVNAETGDSGEHPAAVLDQIHKLLAKVRG